MEKEDAISQAQNVVDLVIKSQGLPEGNATDTGGQQMADFIINMHKRLTEYYEKLP